MDIRFSRKRRFTSAHWDETEFSNPIMMCLHIPDNVFDGTVFKIIVVSTLQQHRLMSITVDNARHWIVSHWRRCRSFVVYCMPFRIPTCTHVPFCKNNNNYYYYYYYFYCYCCCLCSYYYYYCCYDCTATTTTSRAVKTFITRLTRLYRHHYHYHYNYHHYYYNHR